MMYPHGKLSPEQIISTYFVVPNLGIEMALGREYLAGFEQRQRAALTERSELFFIAWPDGTSVEYQRKQSGRELDKSDLEALYKQFHILRAEREGQGDKA